MFDNHGVLSDSIIVLGNLFSPEGWLNIWAGGVLLLVVVSLMLFSALLWLINRRDRRLFKALADSIAQQKALVSNLPGVAFRCRDDAEGTVLFISDEIERLTGYPAGDFGEDGDRRFGDIIHPDDRDAVMIAMHRKTLSGQHFELDFRVCHTSGSVLWVHAKGRGVLDAKKRLHGIDGVLIDVTERHQAETERERLAAAVEQSAESIVITDADGLIQYVNPAFAGMTGYSKEEAIGKNPNILKSGRHDREFYSKMWATLKYGDVWSGRIINKRKDGSLYTEEANITPMRDGKGAIVNYVGVKRDISNEIELEERRQQVKKMESIGRLAGGVAHGFNNMLQAIMGHTEIALGMFESDHPVIDNLNGIRTAAQRSTDLTRQLLAFARKQTINPEALDLNQAVANTIKGLHQIIGRDVALAWRPANNLWHVAMDPVQLDQALVYLFLNSREAIDGEAGKITISTRNLQSPELAFDDLDKRGPADYVALTVSDNGRGMDKETMAHAFEPFFTTKKVSGGAGMGLATVYGIVQQNHGFIDIESQPNRGTTVTIYLPRLLTPERESVSSAPGKEQRRDSDKPAVILLVEDEPSTLHVCKIMLEQEGYRVLTALSSAEALRLAQENSGKIDLLLTDVVMPDMNGYELAKLLMDNYHDLKCLFMSGFTADIIASHGIVEEGLVFVQKPFSVAALTDKVRNALDQKPFRHWVDSQHGRRNKRSKGFEYRSEAG